MIAVEHRAHMQQQLLVRDLTCIFFLNPHLARSRWFLPLQKYFSNSSKFISISKAKFYDLGSRKQFENPFRFESLNSRWKQT